MGLKVWRGDAQARADVWYVEIDGVGTGDFFSLTISGKTILASAGEKDASGEVSEVSSAGIVQLLHEKIQDSDIPEWQEVAAERGYLDSQRVWLQDDDGATLKLTGPSDGTPITISAATGTSVKPVVNVTETVKGVAAVNEVQTITILNSGDVTGGTWTVSFNGQTATGLADDISAGDLETAIEALSTVGAGNVSVTGAFPEWSVEFQGTFAHTNVPMMTASGAGLTGGHAVTVETITDGAAAGSLNEIQRVTFSWNNGSKVHGVIQTILAPENLESVSQPDLSYGFETSWDPTSSLTPTMFPAAWRPTRVELVSNIYDPSTDVRTKVWDIEWGGVHTSENIPQYRWWQQVWNYGGFAWEVIPTWSGVGDFGDTETTQEGGSGDGINEVQRVTVPASTGGTFTLDLNGTPTAAIAYSSTAATLAANTQAALISALGASAAAVTVYSSSAANIKLTVTFGGAFAATDIAEMTGDGSSLTGGTIVVDTTAVAVSPVNEVQTVSLSDNPTGGVFTLSFGGKTTTALTYDESAADVQSGLEALASIGAGNVAVSGSLGGPWTVTFQGALAATDAALLAGDGHNLTITGTQTITLFRAYDRIYTGGAWDASTLIYTVPTGYSPVDDGVAVGDAATICLDDAVGGAPYLARVTARDATTITLSSDTIEGTAPATGTRTCMVGVIAPTGPHHWDDDANWDTSGVPVDDDEVVFQASAVACRYGLNQSSVTPASVTLYASFTGDLGLPLRNTNDYLEYRPRCLQIGDATDSSTLTITIGLGTGYGSGLVRIDTNACQTILKVLQTANSSEDNAPAVAWIGSHASNTLEVTRGSVGVAVYAGETAAVATLTIGWQSDQANDASVTIGSGVSTITTIVKTGGNLDLSAGFTAMTQTGGETVFRAGAAGTLTAQAGDIQYQSSGNCTTLTAYDSTVDFSGGNAAITITNATLYAGAGLIDSGKRVTFTNPPAVKCRIADLEVLDLGTDFHVQRS